MGASVEFEGGGACGRCGWPHRDAHCPACGQPSGLRSETADIPHPARQGPRPEDHPELRAAFQAWSGRDWMRLMSQCFGAIGVGQPSIVKRPAGPAWIVRHGPVAIFVAVDTTRDLLSLEAPLVRVPQTRRIPLLRALLDLNDRRQGLARFCLRDQSIVLRYTEQPDRCPPPKLLAAFRDLLKAAEQWSERLALAYDAETILPRASGQANNAPPSWDLVGEPVALLSLGSEPMELPADALLPAAEGVILEEAEFTVGPDLAAEPEVTGSKEEQELCQLLEHALLHLERGKVTGLDLTPSVARAAIFLAWQRHHAQCPGAVAQLMGPLLPHLTTLGATKLVLGLLERVGSQTASLPQPLEPVLRGVLAARAHFDAAPMPALPRLKDPAEHKALATSLLASFHKLPELPEAREFVAVGAIAELLARGALPERIQTRLYSELELARALSGEHAHRLEQLLERLTQ